MVTRAAQRDDPVAWVSSLPSHWTTTPERLLLYVLALDADHGVTHSGRVVLATRAGIGTDQLRTTLRSLCTPTDARPPLLERMPKRRRQDPDRYRLAPSDRTSEQRVLFAEVTGG